MSSSISETKEFDDADMKEALHAMWRVKQEAVEQNEQPPAQDELPAAKQNQPVPDQKPCPVAGPPASDQKPCPVTGPPASEQKPRPVATPARAPMPDAAPVKTEARAKKEFTRQDTAIGALLR